MSTRSSSRTRKPTSKAAAAASSSKQQAPLATEESSPPVPSPTKSKKSPTTPAIASAAASAAAVPRVDTSAIAAAVAAVEAVPNDLASYPPVGVEAADTMASAMIAASAAVAVGHRAPAQAAVSNSAASVGTPNNNNNNNNNNNGTTTTQSKPKKPGNTLTPETVEYLKAWMMSPEHVSHPYPNDEEKARIMADTGINGKQLTTWFSNNRKRFWKPKMDAEGRSYTTLGNTLSQQTIDYLKAWMMHPSHIEHPYPTEEEKTIIMRDTGIDKKQLTTWFSNNRKRFWKPTMDKLRRDHGIPENTVIPPEILVHATILNVPEYSAEGVGVHPPPPVAFPGLGDVGVPEEVLEEAVAAADTMANMAPEGGVVMPSLEHPEMMVGELEHAEHDHDDVGVDGENEGDAAVVADVVHEGEDEEDMGEHHHEEGGSNKRQKRGPVVEL